MEIKRIIGGSLESNGYIIYDLLSREALIIDPGYRGKVFLKFLEENRLRLGAIILTHHHYDHVGAVKKIAGDTGCDVYMHSLDSVHFKEKTIAIGENDRLHVGKHEARILHLPGHTAGGIAIYFENDKVMFTGDTLFALEIGLTDLEDGSPQDMAKSLHRLVDEIPGDVMIYPGHGTSMTMRFVEKENIELKEALEYEKSLR